VDFRKPLSPLQFESEATRIEFVESEESKYIEKSLLDFAFKPLPTIQLTGAQVLPRPWSNGRRQDSTTYRAVESVCAQLPGSIGCYVRLDALQDLLRLNLAERDIDPTMMLATALLYAFSQSTQAVYAPSLSFVAQEIKDRLGVNKVILHLDEFQKYPHLARKIMTGCKLSLVTGGYPMYVIPI